MKLTIEDLRKISRVMINTGLIRNKSFTNVSINSKKVNKNSLFFAIKGERFDGHDFVHDAFKRGISAAVIERKKFAVVRESLGLDSGKICLILVNDTLKSFGELASVYRSRFLIPVIAVGGSNGKTSAKDFIAYVLSKKYSVLKSEGNFNNRIGLPLTLFRLNKNHEIAVVETGTNQFGEIEELCRIAKPQFGIITNIGKEHLEFLRNIKGVCKEEGKMIDWLESVYGTYFLNKDDKYLVKLSSKRKLNFFTYSSKYSADVTGKVKKFKTFYPEIFVRFGRYAFTATLSMAGKQSFYAALTAAAPAFYFNVPVKQIKQALREFSGITSRRNQIKKSDGFWIIDDTYNSNPDSVKMALENLKLYKCSGKKHVVLGDMLELGKTGRKEHYNIGKLVKKLKFDALYTYGELSYETYRGARGLAQNFYFNDKHVLAEMLKFNLKKNDIVLIKGSRSMKMEEIADSLITHKT